MNRTPEIEVKKFRGSDFRKSNRQIISAAIGESDFIFCVLSKKAKWAFWEMIIGEEKKGRDSVAVFYDGDFARRDELDNSEARLYPFKPNKLNEIERELVGVLKYLITLAGDYIVLEANKKTRVGYAGDGTILYSFKILIPKHSSAGLIKMPGQFGLVGIPGYLPPVKELWETGTGGRGMFTCRVIGYKGAFVSCQPIETSKKSSRLKKRKFDIKFNRKFSPGEVFEYGWGWTWHKMFLKRGPESSGIIAAHHYSKLSQQVSIEYPQGSGRELQFNRLPHLVTLDSKKQQLENERNADRQIDTLCVSKFSWVSYDVQEEHCYQIKWDKR